WAPRSPFPKSRGIVALSATDPRDLAGELGKMCHVANFHGMAHERVAAVLELAGAHHGLVRAELLRPLGVDRSALHRLAASGVLEPTGPGILRVAGSPPTPHQRLLAAVWAAGPRAAASHRA